LTWRPVSGRGSRFADSALRALAANLRQRVVCARSASHGSSERSSSSRVRLDGARIAGAAHACECWIDVRLAPTERAWLRIAICALAANLRQLHI